MEKVLVVDDEPDALEVLGWELSDLGHEVRTARSAAEALEIGAEFDPTVLVTDYYLRGDATGIDVIRRLRQSNPELKSIIVTGMRPEAVRQELAPSENVAVFGKPFHWSAVLERIEVGSAARDR